MSLKQSNKKIKEQTIINFIESNKKNMDINILLVEDNKINLKVATKFIEKWGFKVETAENGLIALDKIKNKVFDIVLMDLQMPEMDGYTATEIIRNTNSNIPIIALTASATTEDIEKTKKIGFNDFIVKPFNPDDLYSKIINIHLYIKAVYLEMVDNKIKVTLNIFNICSITTQVTKEILKNYLRYCFNHLNKL